MAPLLCSLPVLHSMRPLSDDFCFSALPFPPLSFTGLYLSSERSRQISKFAGKTGVNRIQSMFVDSGLRGLARPAHGLHLHSHPQSSAVSMSSREPLTKHVVSSGYLMIFMFLVYRAQFCYCYYTDVMNIWEPRF